MTSAPSARSTVASVLACARARVMTMHLPNKGRCSKKFSLPRSSTVRPMMVSAGALTPAASTRVAIFSSVPAVVRWRGVAACSITATGVDGSRCSINRFAMWPSCFTLM